MPRLTILGIVFGLCAAIAQSLSYVFSRLYVVKCGSRDAVLHLLVNSHLFMGAVSLLLLPLAWREETPNCAAFIFWVIGTAGFYVIGQTGLFFLMRRAQASRVSPLLALKILALAGISAVSLRSIPSMHQCAGIILCVAAAFLLNASGVPLDRRAWGWLVLTCLMYSLSDLCIERTVHALQPMRPVRAAFLGACLTYILCGLGALVLLPFCTRGSITRDIAYSAPFAFFWLIGMLFLFGCFGIVGAVFGNILQSTRGLFSILIGAWLAHRGMLKIEDRVTPLLLSRRITAALMMVAAIWLFLS